MPQFSSKDFHLSLERKVDRYLGPPLVALLAAFASKGRCDGTPPDPKRILLIKLHGIGNIVLLLPVIRQIKARFPGAEIDFLSFRTNAGMLDGIPELALTHYLDRGSTWGLARSVGRTFPRLRRRRYDLVVDFDQFAHFSAIGALMTGAPRRIGFRNPTLRRHRAYTTPVVYLDMMHVSKTFARLARTAGVPYLPGADRRVPVDEGHRGEAGEFRRQAGLSGTRPLVILHPGSSENLTLRRWPAERFARLADRLAGELGCGIVISGGPGEVALAETVRRAMRQPATVSAGRLSVKGFAALCAEADFVVSNDTAALHVASAMGTRVVGLFGPNTPLLYGPLGEDDLVFYRELPCSPCLCNITSKLSDCTRARCMEEITADEVFESVRERYFPA